jgi:hypothetical protein
MGARGEAPPQFHSLSPPLFPKLCLSKGWVERAHEQQGKQHNGIARARRGLPDCTWLGMASLLDPATAVANDDGCTSFRSSSHFELTPLSRNPSRACLSHTDIPHLPHCRAWHPGKAYFNTVERALGGGEGRRERRGHGGAGLAPDGFNGGGGGTPTNAPSPSAPPTQPFAPTDAPSTRPYQDEDEDINSMDLNTVLGTVCDDPCEDKVMNILTSVGNMQCQLNFATLLPKQDLPSGICLPSSDEGKEFLYLPHPSPLTPHFSPVTRHFSSHVRSDQRVRPPFSISFVQSLHAGACCPRVCARAHVHTCIVRVRVHAFTVGSVRHA